MNHLSPEELLDAYYGEAMPHLDKCAECQASLKRLRDELEAVLEYPAPERGPEYGREVWARVAPLLTPRRSPWTKWWLLTPVLAGMLLVAFMAGRWTRPAPVVTTARAGISDKARERVLLLSLSDHLERSQIVLAEVANAEPGSSDFGQERERARELLGANRLLRETAERVGDRADAAVLEDLEHVLLEVANSPDTPSFNQATLIQRRIRDKGLLFKVRITSEDSRERGLKL